MQVQTKMYFALFIFIFFPAFNTNTILSPGFYFSSVFFFKTFPLFFSLFIYLYKYILLYLLKFICVTPISPDISLQSLSFTKGLA